MATATELNAGTELNYTNLVAILLAEEGNGTQFLCLLHGSVAVFLKGQVLTDTFVDQMLNLTNLLGSNLLEVREVEAQVVGSYQRTLLLNVLAQNGAQSLVQQVGTGVVGLGGTTALHIDASHEFSLGIGGDALQQVNGNAVLLLGVEHADGLLVVYEHTGIAYLTAHLAIERSLVEDSLIDNALLLLHLAVLDDAAAVFCIIISNEGAEFLAGKFLVLANDVPVAHLHLSSVAGTCLLLLHLGIETSLVHGHTVFAADKFSQVQGEAKGVKQGERLLTGDF